MADVGSGAGLPGVPLAIARPDLTVVLIEARRSRVAFLELCVDTLELRNATVVSGNAERSGVAVDACLCRAVDDAVGAWTLGRGLLPELAPAGRAKPPHTSRQPLARQAAAPSRPTSPD